jgi:hypothetical protein
MSDVHVVVHDPFWFGMQAPEEHIKFEELMQLFPGSCAPVFRFAELGSQIAESVGDHLQMQVELAFLQLRTLQSASEQRHFTDSHWAFEEHFWSKLNLHWPEMQVMSARQSGVSSQFSSTFA